MHTAHHTTARPARVFLCVLGLAAALSAPLSAAPQNLSYQGKVSVAGTPFTGAGQFKFALVDSGGNTLWSNDDTSVMGSEPTAAVPLTVAGGLYSVRLGDTALAGMTQAIVPTAVAGDDAALRIWFDDGVNGSQLLTPDQPLASVAWALQATEAASVADGSVTAADLAPGAVSASSILTPAAPAAGQVLSYNGAELLWTAAGGAGDGWSLNGNAGAGGAFLGTTDNNWLEFRANNTYAFGVRPADQNLVFPVVPRGFSLSFPEPSGLGIYGTYFDNILNTTLGRTFGGVDVDGPVLYGENGGGLGVVTRSGGTPPFFFDAVTVEEPILMWKNETGQGATIHVGGYGANDHPKLIKFGDADYVYVGEGGADDHMHLRASRFQFLNGDIWYDNQLNKLDTDEQFSATIRAADLYLGHSGRRGLPGRALVDWNNAGTTELWINWANDWSKTVIGGNQTYMTGDASVRTLTIRGGADLAEPFAMSSREVSPGSVVVIDAENPGKLKLSSAAYDRKVAGIVSGANGINPGISMIQEDKLEAGENVALCGRVYVKADTAGGSISVGDLLTTSDTPGHAMRAADHDRAQGAILGKAMTPLDPATGLVLVLVTLQ